MPVRAILLSLTLLASSATGSQPVVTVGADTLRASGVTPGGSVVWFGVGRELHHLTPFVVRRSQVVTDDDRDGTVEWTLDRTIPVESIWVAVDLTTGAWRAGTPEGFPLRTSAAEGRRRLVGRASRSA